jgi:hypothetical protein
MYSLYESYGQPPGMLFSIGFTSSAVFGTFLGILVDKSPSPNPSPHIAFPRGLVNNPYVIHQQEHTVGRMIRT